MISRHHSVRNLMICFPLTGRNFFFQNVHVKYVYIHESSEILFDQTGYSSYKMDYVCAGHLGMHLYYHFLTFDASELNCSCQ